MIDISVIIPVYNAAALLDRCLDSVFNQVGDYNIEVIIVDDGSTDNSVKLIRRRPEQDRIRLFQQQNSGPAKARNKGIAEARGEYLAFLDADDYWMPEFLRETVTFLYNNRECVAVSVAQKHISISGESESPKNWDTITDRRQVILEDFYDFWSKYNHVCTGSILIRSEIAKATGGQREELRVCEDLEFWAYLATFGPIGYIPKVLFVSDGTKVTRNIGWVEKNLPRWRNAVPVEEWQKRILAKAPHLDEHPGFIKARGRLARNLAYSMLLSKRYDLAKGQIKRYYGSYPPDKMTSLLRMAVKNPLNWYIISRALVWREYNRR